MFFIKLFSVELPVLETRRLILRTLTLEDTQAIFAMTSDIDVVCLTAIPLHHSYQEARECVMVHLELYAQEKILPWVVVEKSSNTIIGLCTFFDLSASQRRGEISYLFAKCAWNKGYATEVAKTLVTFGFEALQLARIQATCHPNNYQSDKVLQKIGMQYEGLLRNYKITQGKPSDRKMYAITQEDYSTSSVLSK